MRTLDFMQINMLVIRTGTSIIRVAFQVLYLITLVHELIFTILNILLLINTIVLYILY